MRHFRDFPRGCTTHEAAHRVHRYYKEPDAAPAVRSADIDSFDYFTVVLGGSAGIYVSYTTGRLPLDVANDRVFELGLQFNLQ